MNLIINCSYKEEIEEAAVFFLGVPDEKISEADEKVIYKLYDDIIFVNKCIDENINCIESYVQDLLLYAKYKRLSFYNDIDMSFRIALEDLISYVSLDEKNRYSLFPKKYIGANQYLENKDSEGFLDYWGQYDELLQCNRYKSFGMSDHQILSRFEMFTLLCRQLFCEKIGKLGDVNIINIDTCKLLDSKIKCDSFLLIGSRIDRKVNLVNPMKRIVVFNITLLKAISFGDDLGELLIWNISKFQIEHQDILDVNKISKIKKVSLVLSNELLEEIEPSDFRYKLSGLHNKKFLLFFMSCQRIREKDEYSLESFSTKFPGVFNEKIKEISDNVDKIKKHFLLYFFVDILNELNNLFDFKSHISTHIDNINVIMLDEVRLKSLVLLDILAYAAGVINDDQITDMECLIDDEWKLKMSSVIERAGMFLANVDVGEFLDKKWHFYTTTSDKNILSGNIYFANYKLFLDCKNNFNNQLLVIKIDNFGDLDRILVKYSEISKNCRLIFLSNDSTKGKEVKYEDNINLFRNYFYTSIELNSKEFIINNINSKEQIIIQNALDVNSKEKIIIKNALDVNSKEKIIIKNELNGQKRSIKENEVVDANKKNSKSNDGLYYFLIAFGILFSFFVLYLFFTNDNEIKYDEYY